VLCAINKKEGDFDQTDAELLNMIASTVALSIENARFSDELKKAYREVMELNSAKDRVINHLSHELKTPISVLSASLSILTRRLAETPKENWQPTIDRARRNLQRLLEIQYQVEDIMKGKEARVQTGILSLLNQSVDELEALLAEEIGESSLIEKIRERVLQIYRPKETRLEEIQLDSFVEERLKTLAINFEHRDVNISANMKKKTVCIPREVLQKVVDGLIRNAIENTPDQGQIEVEVLGRGKGANLVVRDFGVGITEKNQRRIFDGFFSTRDTLSYSSKRPFDFNAGGKGADLLRMKIFSEQYNFRITMDSTRCRFIPLDTDICPGEISGCSFCRKVDDCLRSGGTTFSIYFPPAPQKGCRVGNNPIGP
jgi:signal transduction histidine kinase